MGYVQRVRWFAALLLTVVALMACRLKLRHK